MKKLKRFGWLMLLLLAAGAVVYGYALWLREPVYEDRELSAWLEDLVKLSERGPLVEGEANEARRRAWEISHEKAVCAVRTIGAEALPHLLRWLRSAPRPSPLRDKLEDLLDKQSLVKIKLHLGRDRTDEAILGFRTLGAAAEPALPELRRLLQRPATCYQAVLALEAIGPGAFPILAPELTNSNCPVQFAVVDALVDLAPSVGPGIVPILMAGVTNPGCKVPTNALTALGNLGPMAHEVTPRVVSLAREPGQPLAGLALRVLANVSDRPEQYLPLFSEQLTDTNRAGHAAFALACLGSNGVPTLLRALTNQEPIIRSAALAALNPELRKRRFPSAATASGRRLSALSGIFDYDLSKWFNRQTDPKQQDMGLNAEAGRLAGVLDHPDAAVRLRIVQLLTRYGRHSAIGLSRATTDTDERVCTEASAALAKLDIEVRAGAIICGPTGQKRIALLFAGHKYTEGFGSILDELASHKAAASFFLTDAFMTNHNLAPLVARLGPEGHYVGPSSDKRLIEASSEGPKQTLVTREQFEADFGKNLNRIPKVGTYQPLTLYYLPPYGVSNLEIAEWVSQYFYTTINETPGTLSAADDTCEADSNFVSSQAVFDSIVAKEQQDPHGLNGLMLLFHLGSGPGRADKFHARFGELLDYLTGKGYQFVTVDDLIDPQAAQERRRQVAQMQGAAAAFRKRYGLDR